MSESELNEDLDFIKNAYTNYVNYDGEIYTYSNLKESFIKGLIGEYYYDICTKYEKIQNTPNIDILPNELLEDLMKKEIDTIFQFTAVQVIVDSDDNLKGDYIYTYSGPWKLTSRSKKVDEYNKNKKYYECILQSNLKDILTLEIAFDGHGDLEVKEKNIKTAEYVGYSGYSTFCKLYLTQDLFKVSEKDIEFFIDMHGSNPQNIAESVKKMGNIVKNLKDVIEYIEKFIDGTKNNNYYNWVDAVVDVKLRYDTVEKIKTLLCKK